MMKKSINPVWGGRFEQKSSDLLQKINNSIGFDYKLAFQDIKLNLEYSKSLKKAKIITNDEYKKIKKALEEINEQIKSGKFEFSREFEDIHMNIEMSLKKKIGHLSGKIHTGKSRNDQVVTDLKLWTMEKSQILITDIVTIQKTILKKAETHIDVIMPGFTHLQNAQPVLFSHYLLSFFEMFQRDKIRIKNLKINIDDCPLGSGALVGTNFSEIDRFTLAKNLGFSKPSENSIDSVSDRDFVIEFLFIVSTLAMHLSRLAEDFIIWSSSSFNFLIFPDSLSTGSSIMPQKKNPDSAELIRAKTGRIYSALTNMLVVLKGLPSGYSKDLQEDKEAIFDAYESIDIILKVAKEIFESVKVNRDVMLKSSFEGYTTATDLADWMVKKIGKTFREAHQISGKIVLLAEKKKKKLHELELEILQSVEPKINEDVYNFLSPKNSINQKNSYGGTAPQQVKNALSRAQKKLKK
ncbi:MAG: argininosuccinate lyase [Pseudomonadota bacterium]|nr:argininosuccinate lyase [Pseudomonadota bacterium]